MPSAVGAYASETAFLPNFLRDAQRVSSYKCCVPGIGFAKWVRASIVRNMEFSPCRDWGREHIAARYGTTIQDPVRKHICVEWKLEDELIECFTRHGLDIKSVVGLKCLKLDWCVVLGKRLRSHEISTRATSAKKCRFPGHVMPRRSGKSWRLRLSAHFR